MQYEFFLLFLLYKCSHHVVALFSLCVVSSCDDDNEQEDDIKLHSFLFRFSSLACLIRVCLFGCVSSQTQTPFAFFSFTNRGALSFHHGEFAVVHYCLRRFIDMMIDIVKGTCQAYTKRSSIHHARRIGRAKSGQSKADIQTALLFIIVVLLLLE